MGKACKYFSTMKPITLIDLPEEEKTWLQHYGNMPEHMQYNEGSIYDIFHEVAQQFPELPALEFFDVEYKFREFDKQVNIVAEALQRFGVVVDESVTICMPNIPEAIFIIYAVNKIGAVCNVIHPLSDVGEIKNAVSVT